MCARTSKARTERPGFNYCVAACLTRGPYSRCLLVGWLSWLLQLAVLSTVLIREVLLVLFVMLLHQLPDHRVDFIHVEVEDGSVRVAAAAVNERDRGEVVLLLLLLLLVG